MSESEQALQQALKKEFGALVRLFVEIVAGCVLISVVALYGYHLRDRTFPAPWWVSFLIPFSLFFLVYLKSFVRLVQVSWWLFVKPRKAA
jgi:uncharacterized membrane protein YhaH (DUF805 family)